ncbi:MAG: glycosyltransferase [Patescibacteria group bacterium]
MKIAIFSDTFPPQINGVSNVVYRSSIALARRGHDVRIFTVGCSEKDNPKILFADAPGGRASVVFLPSIPFWGYSGERITLPLGFAMNKIRKFRPDVIHTHTPFGVGWEAVFAAKMLKIPLFGTHHTFYDHYLKLIHLDYNLVKIFSWRYTVAYYNRCDVILSPSQSLAEVLKSYGVVRSLKILPNSINTDFFHPIVDGALQKKSKNTSTIAGQTLIYIGRVSYEKSIDIIIRALAAALQNLSHLQLIIVGDGPARIDLEKLTRDLGVETNVRFLGFCRGSDLLEVLWRGDIFLTASKSENMPISILEAMAAGLPIIGVDALGVPEIVKDGLNGFIVAPDNPDLMAQKIVELAGNNDLRNNFASASRELALNYAEDKITWLLEDIYQNK